MVLMTGSGGAYGRRDLLAALDRRQAIVMLPDDVSAADYALATATAGAAPAQIIRCGRHDAAQRLVDLLSVNQPGPVVLLEETEAGAVAILLAPHAPDRPALACLELAGDGHGRDAEIFDVTGWDGATAAFAALLAQCGTRQDSDLFAVVNAQAGLPAGMPALTGVLHMAAAVQGRRVPAAGAWPDGLAGIAAVADADPGVDRPVWPRFWPPPAMGARTALAALPGGRVIAVTAPLFATTDRATAAHVAPHAFSAAAADAAALAAMLTADSATKASWPDPGSRPPCRAELLANDPASLARASARLRDRIDPVNPARYGTDPVSGSSFVTDPIGAAPVAFVFSGFGSGHPGMLRRLCDALPGLADHLEAVFGPALRRVMPVRTLYPPRASDRRTAMPLQGPPTDIAAAEFIGHAVYAWIARDLLGLRPSAAIGLSLGGVAMAPVLCGVPSRMAEVALGPGGLIDVAGRLAGNAAQPDEDDWTHWWMGGSASELIQALQGFPALHVLMQCDHRLLLVGGPRSEATNFIKAHRALGGITASGMRHLHTPMIAPAIDGLWDAVVAAAATLPREHLRGIDFFVSDRPIRAGASTLAMEQFCRQAGASLSAPVDLPFIVRAAYRRGIRVFVGCGSRDDTIGWIGNCLNGLPHVAVSLATAKLDPWHGLLSAARLLRAHDVLPGETALDRAMRMPA